MAASEIDLSIHPNVDITSARGEFERNGIVRIDDFFPTATATATEQVLRERIRCRLLTTDDHDQPRRFSQGEVRAMGAAKVSELVQEGQKRAAANRGYLYYTYPMIEAYLSGDDPGSPIHRMTEFINSPPFLELGRRVLACPDIVKADAHATCYAPGHYLTRHIDITRERERRAAYVLGFSRDWQPDWGGLLLFLNDRQDVSRGFLPRFNSLTIFDINLLHTVTQVSSFAPDNRLSITGWFRTDPAYAAPG